MDALPGTASPRVPLVGAAQLRGGPGDVAPDAEHLLRAVTHPADPSDAVRLAATRHFANTFVDLGPVASELCDPAAAAPLPPGLCCHALSACGGGVREGLVLLLADLYCDGLVPDVRALYPMGPVPIPLPLLAYERQTYWKGPRRLTIPHEGRSQH